VIAAQLLKYEFDNIDFFLYDTNIIYRLFFYVADTRNDIKYWRTIDL
jgi:hypothetical protein